MCSFRLEHQNKRFYSQLAFQEADGGALVGRTAAQLQFTAHDFDDLPYFRKETLVKLQEYARGTIIRIRIIQ